MKKRFFKMMVFGLVLLFGAIKNIPAQNTQPVIGYDKVPWGSSYDAVKRAYPALNEKQNSGDGTSSARIGGEGIISDRTFDFYNDKLYSVQVTYKNNISPTDTINVIGRIIQVYGPFDESSWDPRWVNNISYVDETTYYRRYSRELTIEVLDFRLLGGVGNNGRNSTALYIYFRNPLIEEQMKSERAQF